MERGPSQACVFGRIFCLTPFLHLRTTLYETHTNRDCPFMRLVIIMGLTILYESLKVSRTTLYESSFVEL